MTTSPCRGAGLGLRMPHLREVLKEQPDIPWFEVHICNYMGGGLNRALLEKISENYPLSFHGVNLNLAGVDQIDTDYLKRLKLAVDEFNPVLVSDHACFTANQGQFFHDLLPVPYTEEAIKHLIERIRYVQDFLGRQILIENLSRYYCFDESELSEGEFLAAVSQQADCGLLLDLNNAYVNQLNLNESVDEFLSFIPTQRVQEIHLAGFDEQEGICVDTHGAPVHQEVWDIYEAFSAENPDIPTLIERDNNLPALSELILEQQKAQSIYDRYSRMEK